MSKVARREVDPSEHTLALLEIIKERRQKENKLEKVGTVILILVIFYYGYVLLDLWIYCSLFMNETRPNA